jgi:hypothetical protein
MESNETTIPLTTEEREILQELQARLNEAFNVIARIRGLRGKRVRLSEDMAAMIVTQGP